MKSLSIIFRALLVVGLIVSPLYPRVSMAGGHAMAMARTHMISDQTSPRADAINETSPCHDGKIDCDKTCPCMAACMSLSVQCLPSTASTFARIVVVGKRLAVDSEAQLANLTAPPPARPPRA